RVAGRLEVDAGARQGLAVERHPARNGAELATLPTPRGQADQAQQRQGRAHGWLSSRSGERHGDSSGPSHWSMFVIGSPPLIVAMATKTCMLMLLLMEVTWPSHRTNWIAPVCPPPQPYLHWAMSDTTRPQAS